MSEMYYFGVLASQQEMVARFADALPPNWSPFIELLKHTGVLDAVNVNIYEFIQKLEHKNEEEIRKAKRIAPIQNTEMDLAGFKQLASSSSAQQPKLQMAFMSNTSSFPSSAPPPIFDSRAYLPPPHVIAQAHALSKPQLDPSAWLPKPQPQPQVSTTQPQFDPSVDCGPAIQLGNGDQTRTAFYAEIVKNVNDGESSGNDDSLGYSGSTDEDGSGVSDCSSESDVKEGMDSEADNLSNNANKKSDLIKKADATSEEMEKILTEDGSFSSQTAFMANVTVSTSQVLDLCWSFF
ncbi:hypothetical protein HanIR_Chr03g0140991 [Helianthus annuus]|nr:hypothetical protein HanIR_Chr03g0140991 [Helianthus annuus]